MLVGGVGAVHMGHISHMHYPLRSYDLWSKRVRERERRKIDRDTHMANMSHMYRFRLGDLSLNNVQSYD